MVFVTGGTGFLGAYIIKHLVERGLPVRALRRRTSAPFFISEDIWKQVEWVQGDVLDVDGLYEAVRGAQGVIHAAALVSYLPADRVHLAQTNVTGTANVVNAAIEAGVKRFVHISSIAALGKGAHAEKITEARKWEDSKSNTYYGVTKHLAEMEVWRGFAEGLHGVILNPSMILGYSDWNQSSSTLFKNVYKEFPFYTTGVNGFVGVDDVAEAAVQALQSNLHQQRFIVNAENWSFQKLFNSIATDFGVRPPRIRATPLMGELAWRSAQFKSIITGRKPVLSKETARVAQLKTEFDNTALLQALPQFSYTPLKEVIADACTQYKQALHSGLL